MYVQQSPYYKANNPSAIKMGLYKMCVASLEGDNWVEFCYHSASEIWPGKSGLIRGIAFGGSGLIKGRLQ